MHVSARRQWVLAQALVVACALIPLAWAAAELALLPMQNPTQCLQRATGRWALRLLLLALCITPLRSLTSWHPVVRFRRTLGLLAFAYATLHMMTYAWLDLGLDARDILFDAGKRPFVILGASAFVLMLPLAATSTDAAKKALGGRAWKRLHRAVHVVAMLAVLHHFLLTKVDLTPPLLHAACAVLLLGWRVVAAVKARRRRREPVRAMARHA